MAEQESSQTAAPKKAPAKKAAAKKAAKRVPAKKAAAKKAAAKKSSAKKGASRSSAAKRPAKKATAKKVAKTSTAKKTAGSRTSKLVGSVRDTGSSAAAGGKAVVAKATVATRKPVEASKGLAGAAGTRVASLSQALLAPSVQLLTAAQGRAKGLAVDPAGLRALADRAIHSDSGRHGPLGEVVDEFRTLGRLVAAYSRGDYRDIPLDSLVTVIAGLVYVVTPLDLIPEKIPVAGIADDAVAVGFVIRQVHHELTAFRAWEAAQPDRG